MTERITQEEYRQLEQSLTEKVLERAESDPAWKQQLTDDPNAALEAANFPEVQRLKEIHEKNLQPAELSDEDVQGQICTFPTSFVFQNIKADKVTLEPMPEVEPPPIDFKKLYIKP